MKSPNEIIKSLDQKDRETLNRLLSLEKSKLHIEELTAADNRRIVDELKKIIDGAVIK